MDCHHLTIMDGVSQGHFKNHDPWLEPWLEKMQFGSSTKEKQTPNIENH